MISLRFMDDWFLKKLIYTKLKDPELCKFRYRFVKRYTKHLCSVIQLDSISISKYVDLSSNLECKVGGYNIKLDLFLVLNSLFSQLPKSVRNLVLSRFFNSQVPKQSYELMILLNYLNSRHDIDRYHDISESLQGIDRIYFASMNNYLTSIIPDILRKLKTSCDSKTLLILPKESISWINYGEVVKYKIPHIFIEDIVFQDPNYITQYYKIKEFLQRKYEAEETSLLEYDGVSLDPLKKLIKKFVLDFLPIHLVVVGALEKFLESYATSETAFYIARDRRALENAFIQIGASLSGKTRMLLHGMLSKSICEYLWVPGRFENVKIVYANGQHDKDSIYIRQTTFGLKKPKIIYIPSRFIQLNNIQGEYVLFVAQSYTNSLIPLFAKEYPRLQTNYPLIIRLHPEDKEKLSYYKKYGNKWVKIDNLKTSISNLLSRSAVVLTFTSTVALESMYNNIPTLFLNFNRVSYFPNIFVDELPEGFLTRAELNTIVLTESNWKHTLQRALKDTQFRRNILKINKKLLKYFIDDA